jgi:hypothetical protein
MFTSWTLFFKFMRKKSPPNNASAYTSMRDLLVDVDLKGTNFSHSKTKTNDDREREKSNECVIVMF